jgi:DNA repair exonuclease SbcCD ATPase subunit
VRGVNTLVYSSFSEGEKLRIDLALIFAWRELSMMQSGLSCNLLFFDEMTDSSMDNEGVELFIKTINTFTNTNTWIITHTPEKLESYVRSIIEIEKYNGFSRIK